MVSDIREELSKLKKSAVFKLNRSSHVVVLICEMVNYFTALKETEIYHYLTSVNVEVSKEDIKSKLFLLEEFGLIKKEIYSDSVFYMRSDETYHRLSLSFNNKEHPDTLRIQTECLTYYNNDTKHKNRLRTIAHANRGLKK